MNPVTTASETKSIFGKLQDETSRTIFLHRLHYYLDGDYSHILNMILDSIDFLRGVYPKKELGGYVTELFNRREKRPLILYGTGRHSGIVYRLVRHMGYDVICFADSDPYKWDMQYEGLPIISPDKLGNIAKRQPCYAVISNVLHEDAIYKTLLEIGIPPADIFFSQPSWEPSYFDNDVFNPENGEIYLDVGAFDGESVLSFARACPCYRKILAMEPDSDNQQRIDELLSREGLANVEIIPKGAWSENTVLSFTDTHDDITSVDPNGSLRLDVAKIDDVIGDNAVTMIKMDIEGAELEALRGAEKTIRAHKPRLAISIYHKPEDILTLPLYIQILVPEYRFTLRHYRIDWPETVLYAVPQY